MNNSLLWIYDILYKSYKYFGLFIMLKMQIINFNKNNKFWTEFSKCMIIFSCVETLEFDLVYLFPDTIFETIVSLIFLDAGSISARRCCPDPSLSWSASSAPVPCLVFLVSTCFLSISLSHFQCYSRRLRLYCSSSRQHRLSCSSPCVRCLFHSSPLRLSPAHI